MSTKSAPLLVELFTEELPPKALKRLETAFAEGIAGGLRSRGLLEEDGEVESFSTPRRLAVRIPGVRAVAPDQAFTEKLMPVSVGLDKSGAATPALLKKLAAKSLAHVDVASLERESDGKSEQLVYRGVAKGQSLQVALESALVEAIAGLPIPKVMSYQLLDGSTVKFVRPAHGLVALHGADVVEVAALGLAAGRITHGHRFQGRADIKLASASDYESALEREGSVIASFDARRASIHALLREVALSSGAALGDTAGYAALLDEVTALVERPAVYAGSFDAEFLAVPPECLVLTMKQNQKYFPLFDAAGKLSNRFLIVSNMQLDDPHNVIEGNERVVRPRLADARFFFETDRKTLLEARVAKLDNVVYHNKLGTQGARVQRVRAIAAAIAALLPGRALDAASVDLAARLAKADLLTDMVGEFPELQGIMGRYYALHEGLPQQVADAIEDHYRPRFAGDALPRAATGLVVALADKLETLVGLFGVGQLPTGDKDPFALRRHALGVIRIVVESNFALDLDALIAAAAAPFGALIADPAAPLAEFVFERFASYLKDQGCSAQEIDAVLSLRPQRLAEVKKRLDAVRAFAELPDAQALAAANKRIGNILKKAAGPAAAPVQEGLLREDAEQALHAAMVRVVPEARRQFDLGNYTDSLKMFAQLRGPVDAFFEAVMVNVDDAALRNNRLALLSNLHGEMNRIADISRLSA